MVIALEDAICVEDLLEIAADEIKGSLWFPKAPSGEVLQHFITKHLGSVR